MAASQKNKRPLPGNGDAAKGGKRRKLGASTSGGVGTTRAPVLKEKVRLDDLNWKEVAMPDRLDDYEGFFGLEEIEDVDVVKEGGMVSYHASSEAAKKPVSQDGATGTVDHEDDLDDAAGGEEWSGFDDDEKVEASPDAGLESQPDSGTEPKPTASQTKKEKKEKAKKDAKSAKKGSDKKKDAKPSVNPQQSNETSFAAVADMFEDNADEGVDISAWRALKLSAETLSSLSTLKFSEPTLIQKSAIPEILAGHDVIGKASTGSGKTLAFGIPIIERFLELQAGPKPKTASQNYEEKARTPALALILSPTRELAHQISAHMTALCDGLTVQGPSIATVTGGLSIVKQQRLLKTADIVIGTPGRLWEVISGGQGILKWLQKIQFLVVDEADRLLSQGHFKEVEEIINVLDRAEDNDEESAETEAPEVVGEERQRQTLVFSATFHKGLQQKLTGKVKPSGGLLGKNESMEYLLKKLNFREEKPKFVDVNPISQMAVGLREGMVECGGTEKVCTRP